MKQNLFKIASRLLIDFIRIRRKFQVFSYFISAEYIDKKKLIFSKIIVPLFVLFLFFLNYK